jgi:hypothetical protein
MLTGMEDANVCAEHLLCFRGCHHCLLQTIYIALYSLLIFIMCNFVCYIAGYPLAVKLGTITKDGKADVFSYDEDNMVEDPNLIVHLAHFGINIAQMEKVVTSHFISLWLC